MPTKWIIYIIMAIVFFIILFSIQRKFSNKGLGKEPEFVGLRPLFTDEPLPYDPLSPQYFYQQILDYHRLPNQDVSYIEQDETQIEYVQPEPLPPSNPNRRWKRQSKCCEIMEKVYGKSFSSIRPKWLKNPETGGNLELDCYNEELNIALEYNGIQHYIFPNSYHKTYEDFISSVRRDKFKYEQCEKNDTYLIVVPYNIKDEELETYIHERLPENQISDSLSNQITIVEYSV